MAESSISVAVRVRPFSAKESAQLAPQEKFQPFLGDGGLSAGSPSKIVSSTNGNGTGPGLRSKFLRSIITPVDDKVLIFDPPEHNPYGNPSSSLNTFAHGPRKPRDVRYAFDRVFDDKCGQEMVFENTTKPLLDGILNGFNASVFAYGATGCGKTHTISGTAQDPGVIFLTMRELYRRIEESREESDVHVRLSYLEIYNEQIRDLLSPTPTPPGSGLMLREDASNKISVVGITEHTPESPQSVLEMIQEGNLRRTMSPTEANAVSSRSHAVLQINVTQRPRTADTVMETTSASLNIIDLAGSERAAATRNDGARMKEGANINKSLLALGNCINALCQSIGQRTRHIPYRNSKLTRLLKFSLGGNCKTVMIVCVSPSSAHYDETYNTLKYANQAKNIRTKVSRNMLNVDRHVAQYVQAIHELKAEVAELKAKLADRAAIESAADKRKKAEMLKEVEDCKSRLRKSTDEIKIVISQKAGLEALFMAANVRLSSLRQRLQQMDEDKSLDGSAVDVECEKQVLRKLMARQDAIIADRTMQLESQSLSNSIQAYRACLVAASHNSKFDEEAAFSIRTIGESMAAEVDAHKVSVVCETMSKQLGAGMAILADFAVLGARSTMALKETAREIDNMPPSSSESQLKDESKNLTSQLRFVAKLNDDLFSRHVGLQTAEMPSTGLEQRGSVLRRARSSISVQPTTTVPPTSSARLTKRTSRASLMTNTSATLNSLQTSKTARRPSTSLRRTSMGMRRISSASRRASQNTSDALGASTSGLPRKSFRWADEAGEGTIDDKKVSVEQVQQGGTASLRSSIGPSRALRTSLTASLGMQASGAQNGRLEPEHLHSAPTGNSSAEWEDFSKEVGATAGKNNLVKTDDRQPLSASLSLNKKPPPPATKKREGGAMFERNFLRKKATEEAMREGKSSSDAMETDESLDSSFTNDADEGRLLNGQKAQVDMPSDDVVHLTSVYSGATVRSSPYRRPSRDSGAAGIAGESAKGVGPIRTKARSSGGMTSDNVGAPRKAVTSTATVPHRSTRPSAAQPSRH